MENTDDDALNWAGDEARQRGGGTWNVPERRKGASLSPSRGSSDGEAVVSRPDDGGFDTPTPSATQPTTIGDSIALVATGIFAGVFLLFTIAWLITALRNPVQIADPLGNFMFQFGLWCAVAAGPVAFVACLNAGRNRLWARFVWLIVAALVLIPWPYFSWAG